VDVVCKLDRILLLHQFVFHILPLPIPIPIPAVSLSLWTLFPFLPLLCVSFRWPLSLPSSLFLSLCANVRAKAAAQRPTKKQKVDGSRSPNENEERVMKDQ